MEIGEHDEGGEGASPLSTSFLHESTAGAPPAEMKVVISSSGNPGLNNHIGGLGNPKLGITNPNKGLLNSNGSSKGCDGVNASNGVIQGGFNSNAFATVDDVRVPASLELKARKPVRYRECLKNHAVNLGGHATDGCGEFMPSGADGTLEALTCAACRCHRNFHRREAEGEHTASWSERRFHGSFRDHKRVDVRSCAFPSPLPLSSPTLHSAHMMMGDADDFADGCMLMSPCSPSSFKKRFRTKFTTEQKERMASFANALGWRIQKQDEDVVAKFCAEIGIKRHVLKVWMHNNKNTFGKKISPNGGGVVYLDNGGSSPTTSSGLQP
eukprot:c21748_g2_i1 orf=65-1042(+)